MLEMLTPIFAAAGAVLASLPIVLHLFRRTPAVRAPFSLVRFLTPTLPKTTRRSTLEHWPLMLLRILAVALIALAFARPFQRQSIARDQTAESGQRIAVVLDASASMRRDGMREAIDRELQEIAGSLNPADLISVTQFSAASKRLLSVEEWLQTEPQSRLQLLDRVLETWTPDWRGTNTGLAVMEAAEEVSREQQSLSAASERKVILITDFQESSDLDNLKSGSWPDNVKLDLRIVGPTEPGNAGLSLFEDTKTAQVRIRVTNSGDARKSSFRIQPFDSAGQPSGPPIAVDVPPGQRRTIRMPDPASDQPPIRGAELLEDPHPFDNVVDLPDPEVREVRIAHAGSTNANDQQSMRYYLQRAIDGEETETAVLVDLISADGVVIPPPGDVRLAIITDSIPDTLLPALKQFSERGGSIFISLRSMDMARSVMPLLDPETTFEEATVNDYAMMGNLDFSAPLLVPFSDPRFSDFSSIRFWHYRSVNISDAQTQHPKVLARFDSGNPALLQYDQPSGGIVYVLTAGWHPEDSQFALSARFPAMLSRLIRLGYPRVSGHRIVSTGHRLKPSELASGTDWNLMRPDGSSVLSSVTPSENTSATGPSVELDEPGRWTLRLSAADGPRNISLLANVPSSESRTEPLPAGQLQVLGLSADVASVKQADDKPDPEKQAQLAANELESRQRLWRYCLLAGLGCLILESLLAAVLERRQRPLEA